MFNPFKYQYRATYLRDENGHVLTRVQKGSEEQEVYLPKAILPSELNTGDSFILSLQAEESAKNAEYKTLQRLLTELIN